MSDSTPPNELQQLAQELDAVVRAPDLKAPEAHARRLALVGAILCEAFRRRGLRATLVGGGAIEFYAPEVGATQDIDLVIERLALQVGSGMLDEVFRAMGFAKGTARHWVRDDLFVEVPGYYLQDPVEEYQVGPYRLRVIAKEAVLVGRIVEFAQTGEPASAGQAVLFLRALGGQLDWSRLQTLLRRERAGDAYNVLRRLAAAGPLVPITAQLLREEWDRLRGKPVVRWDDASQSFIEQPPPEIVPDPSIILPPPAAAADQDAALDAGQEPPKDGLSQ